MLRRVIGVFLAIVFVLLVLGTFVLTVKADLGFGEWTILCIRDSGCAISKTLTIPDSAEGIVLAVRRVDSGETALYIRVPDVEEVRSKLLVRIDDVDLLTLQDPACGQGNCVYETPLSVEALPKIVAGDRIEFSDPDKADKIALFGFKVEGLQKALEIS